MYKILIIILFIICIILVNNKLKKKETFFNKNNFNPVYCITVDRFKDRQKYMKNQFNNQNLHFNFHYGQDKYKINNNINNLINNNYLNNNFYIKNKKKINNGSLACLISHCMLYKKLLNVNGNKFLIFEDDCEILPDFFKKLSKYYNYVPKDWDMIWLGHNRLKGKKINKYVLKPQNNPGVGYNAQHHCYLIKKSSIDKILNILLPIKNFETKDSILRNNFNNFNAYFIITKLAIQKNNLFKSERL